jgi:hypothetical protein
LLTFSFSLLAQVDQWLDTSTQLVSGLGFETLCGRLNDYLSMRSFFVGFTTTAADFSIWGQLHGEIIKALRMLLTAALHCGTLLGIALSCVLLVA